MRALLSFVLALALALPAQAGALRKAVLSGGPCLGVVLSVDYVGGGGCYNGSPRPWVQIPYTFTRASQETCYSADGTVASTAANNVPCVTNAGYASWQASTNVFLNSATGVTQSVTTTAVPWTLSFYGTGSIVLSGTCAGTLNGTGASNRVSATATPSAGSCTLTVSGSATSVQYEAASSPTPYIPTVGASATRAADVMSFPWTPAAQGAVVASWAQPVTVTGQRVIGGGTPAPLYLPTSTAMGSYNGAVILQNTGLTLTAGVVQKTAMAWTTSSRQMTTNGGVLASDANGIGSISTLYVGSGNGVSNWLNEHIRFFAVYSTVKNTQAASK